MKKVLILALIAVLALTGCRYEATEVCDVSQGIPEEEIIDFSDTIVYVPRLENGSSVIIGLPTDEWVMINCGSGEDFPAIYEKLRSMEIGIIDYVILNSTKDYSSGGIDKVIQNFEVCNVYVSDDAENSEVYKKVETLCQNNDVMFTKVCSGSRIYDFGKVCIDVVDSEKNSGGEEVNSLSLYVLLGNVAVFLEGECDIAAQAKMATELKDYIKSDIYIIPSQNAMIEKSRYLIEEISPEYAVIPVHSGLYPVMSVVNKLDDAEVLRTDVNGDIFFKIENDEISLRTES